MPKMKFIYLALVSLFIISCTSVDNEQYDTRAIASLDALSEAIGKLNSASYTIDQVSVDENGLESYMQHDVYFRGPNKMYLHSTGSKGSSSIWYDGQTLSRFAFDKNTYATVEAPDDIIKTIDFVHDTYGIDIPAADFFYPDFTDNILDAYEHVLFVGDETTDGVETTSIVASDDNTTVQIWMTKANNLPLRLLIDSKNSDSEFYQITFSNLRIDPELPDLMFEFNPPSDSEKTEF